MDNRLMCIVLGQFYTQIWFCVWKLCKNYDKFGQQAHADGGNQSQIWSQSIPFCLHTHTQFWFSLEFASSLTVFVKINYNQGTCILQNLLQCITFISEAAWIAHHATVTKTSWLWAHSFSDSPIKAHIRKEHFIWMSRVPDEKTHPREPPFHCNWMIWKTSFRSPRASFLAGSMCVYACV